jgi:hypothetical protein
MNVIEAIKDNLSNWNNEAQVTLSQDLSILDEGVGYMSGKKVAYNPTADTIIISPFALENLADAGGLGKALNNVCKKIHAEIYFNVCSVYDCGSKPAQNQFYPFKRMEFEQLFINNITSDERMKAIEDYIESVDFSDMIRNIAAASAIGNTGYSPYWIDWELTLEGIDDTTAITLLLSICSSPTFSMVDQARKEQNFNLDVIKSSPFYHFLLIMQPLFPRGCREQVEILKGIKNKDVAVRDECLKGAFDTYLINSETKKNSFINYGYSAAQIVKWMPRLLNLIPCVNESLLYAPFFFNATMYRNHSNDFLRESPLVKVLRPLKDRQDKSIRALLNIHNSFECISDIPEDYLLKISEARKKTQDYVTSTGLPYTPFKRLIARLEKDPEWTSRDDYKPFPQVRLSPSSNRRLMNADSNKKNPNMGWTEGLLSTPVREVLVNWTKISTNGVKAGRINHVADWLINLPEKINTLHDISAAMIYDPIGTIYDGVTFHEYLKNKKKKGGDNLSKGTQKQVWTVIHEIFKNWANLQTAAMRVQIPNPVPPTNTLYKSNGLKKNTTHRRLMPSSVYDELLAVAIENDYEFARSQSRFTANILNHETGKMEMVFLPQCARIMHLLLLVPLRGSQIRWLDEGLMDSEIWDFETEQYIITPSSLANYIYEDGKTHNARHGNTGVIRNIENDKNATLGLYISTNKTKSEAAQRRGHTGYEIPWPYVGGNGYFRQVYDIIEDQKKWNVLYCPASETTPVKTTDENSGKYDVSVWDNLPYFTPLFRNPKQMRLSAMVSVDKEKYAHRDNLYLPFSSEDVRNYYYLLIKETERRIKAKFPELAGQNILFDSEGNSLYDIHGLRVFGISSLMSKGVDEKVVQMLVGHATAIMTQYYHRMAANDFKKILLEAQKKQGVSVSNELGYLRNGETLIANFGLVPEWQNEGAKAVGDPISETKSIARLAGGGICFGYSCAYGGLSSYINVKGDEVYEIKQLEQGAMRCGNCRYWRTGPRFLQEQILHLNLVGQKVKDLAQQRLVLIAKSKSVYNDSTVNNPELLAANYSKEIDDINVNAASYLQEQIRRLTMLEETMSVAGLTVPESTKLDIFNDAPNGVGEWMDLSEFDTAMELTTQGAVLGVNMNADTISFKKLKKFLTQISTVAGTSDSLIFEADDEIKRAAVLYKIQGVVEEIGRTFTDEEFCDARYLIETLEKADLLKIKKHLISVDKEVLKLTNNKKVKKIESK